MSALTEERFFEIFDEALEKSSAFSQVKGDVTSLKSDVTSLKSDVTSLKSDVTSLKSDVFSLKKGQEKHGVLLDYLLKGQHRIEKEQHRQGLFAEETRDMIRVFYDAVLALTDKQQKANEHEERLDHQDLEIDLTKSTLNSHISNPNAHSSRESEV